MGDVGTNEACGTGFDVLSTVDPDCMLGVAVWSGCSGENGLLVGLAAEEAGAVSEFPVGVVVALFDGDFDEGLLEGVGV